MGQGDLLVLLLKQTLAVSLVLLILRALRGSSAARRVFAARCGLAVLLLMPLLWPLAPPLRMPLPHAITALLEPEAVLPPLARLAAPPARAEAFAAPARAVQAGRLLLCVYGAGVLLHFLHTGLGLARLGRIGRKAAPVQAPTWTGALARLRARVGVAREIHLLVSDQVRSPMSWGLCKPVIVLDPHTLANADPDAVIAHELAHIARHDWPAMLLGRALVALYWWHPLMHLLTRTSENDAEHAADDAVLAAGVPASNYAATLLAVSRHAFSPAPASHIAGRGQVLVRRIGALLEERRARGAVRAWQWTLGSVATMAMAVTLGALVQRGEHVVWPDRLLPEQAAAGSAEQLLEATGNASFIQLAHAMRTGDFAQRHAAADESFRQREAIPALVLALQDSRPAVRRLAAWGLSEMRFPETAPAVAALLADPVAEVRAEAAGALGDIGDTRWLQAMHAMLRDADPAVRARVAHALGDLAQAASAAPLRHLLQDADEHAASEARWALEQLR